MNESCLLSPAIYKNVLCMVGWRIYNIRVPMMCIGVRNGARMDGVFAEQSASNFWMLYHLFPGFALFPHSPFHSLHYPALISILVLENTLMLKYSFPPLTATASKKVETYYRVRFGLTFAHTSSTPISHGRLGRWALFIQLEM